MNREQMMQTIAYWYSKNDCYWIIESCI